MSHALKVPAVVWKTEKPNLDRCTRVSSDFPLLGEMWHLEMIYTAPRCGFGDRSYRVELVKKELKLADIFPRPSFTTLTYIHFTKSAGLGSNSSGSEVCNKFVDYGPRTTLVVCPAKPFAKKLCDPLYKDCLELTVVCVFMDLPRAFYEFRSLNETSYDKITDMWNEIQFATRELNTIIINCYS